MECPRKGAAAAAMLIMYVRGNLHADWLAHFYCAQEQDLCTLGRDDHKLLRGITHRAIFRKCCAGSLWP